MNNSDISDHRNDVAIIGVTCRFPGARGIDEFWRNLRDGVESISSFSDDELKASGVNPLLLTNPHYVKSGPVLDDIDLFDASFFELTSREAEITDPQQRIFLECAWEALENAGYDSETYKGLIGVYAGVCANSYLLHNLVPNPTLKEAVRGFQMLIGNDKDYLATRVSYKLNLKGPSVVIQTACSTSLVAVHLACESLLTSECDMALAGAVTIKIPQKVGYLYEAGAIASPDGHCRAFDARAQGTISGSGVGVVVLKRLQDALADGDGIQAVIKGSAINNDGSLKVGYTAPSVNGQAAVIEDALAIAGIEPETVTYIETHGTGTPLGDPVEIAALTQAFRAHTESNGFCAIGSVKTNIGHLDTAAGIAGLIKTLLALKHKQIPPSLNFVEPNPKIDFASTPFYVNSRLSEWQTGGTPRRAGVSSFGIGGTNAHVIMEEPPPIESSGASDGWQLLVLSAKTASALDTMTINLARHLTHYPEQNLADVAYTLQVGRRAFSHRRMLVCRDTGEAAGLLQTLDSKRVFTGFQERKQRPVVFMFSGEGAQYVNMGHELYREEPSFREQLDLCSEILEPHLGLDLRQMIYPHEGAVGESNQALNQTFITQPALFVIEYALAHLWKQRGVTPDAMIGHGVGEYVAACLAGVLSLEDGLSLVAERGKLMQSVPAGAMLAVPLAEKELQPLLGENLSMAAINGISHCVISGPTAEVEKLQKHLAARGVNCRLLPTSHAYHSQMMEHIVAPFTAKVKSVELKPPRIPYISSVTGTWITSAEATDANYWGRHLRQTVRLADGLRELLKEPDYVLLEAGPGQTLTALAEQHPDAMAEHLFLSSLCSAHAQSSEMEFSLKVLGQLWLAGIQINWHEFHALQQRRRIPLPTYPFERQRYWVEAPRQVDDAITTRVALDKKQEIADWFYIPVWKQAMPLARSIAGGAASRNSCCLIFVDTCGVGYALAKRMEQAGHHVITVMAGQQFGKRDNGLYTINPRARRDYELLFEEMSNLGRTPEIIAHLWSVTPDDHTLPENYFKPTDLGFYSLLFLTQSLGRQDFAKPLRLYLISNNVQQVESLDVTYPEKASILGPHRVLPQEFPNIICRSIDIIAPQTGTPPEDKLIEQLLAELAVESSDATIAYRGNQRWVQTFEAAPLDEGVSRLRQGGVYLITGGLGGLGLQFAEYLARHAQSKLVLVGRSSFPEQEQWSQWLAVSSDHNEVNRKIRKLLEIERAGAEVMIVSADVTDREQMQMTLDRTLERFGALHGVIHAAGIAGGGLIQWKAPETAAKVLAPKVQGTQVLESILKETRLDFLVLCSSTVSLTGGVGQVDYCAANAFLDAFARYHTSKYGVFTVSINWDVWQDVGMAARTLVAGASERIQSAANERETYHPLLTECLVETLDRAVYRTRFSVAEQWILKEHQIYGKAVVPGTAYLEMIREAVQRCAGPGAIEIRDLFFLAPLVVDDHREVYTIIERDGAVFNFLIISKSEVEDSEEPEWLELVNGKVARIDSETSKENRIKEIEEKCRKSEIVVVQEEEGERKETAFAFGPRWRVLKKVNVGTNEALAVLELPKNFYADLEQYRLHPSLLDVATSFAVQHMNEGYYLPLSYKKLKFKRPLSKKIYSYIKNKDENLSSKETVTFDIIIMDERGSELVEIVDFTMRRLKDAGLKFKAPTGRHVRQIEPRPDRANGAQAYYEQLIAGEHRPDAVRGILSEEGVAALSRILSANVPPQVIVSTKDFHQLINRINTFTPSMIIEEAEKLRRAMPTHSRPDLKTPYVAPGNNFERSLAAIWAEVLGVEQVGVEDNFFELGGDSILSIQIMARAREAGIEITAKQMFEQQTVRELAAVAHRSGSESEEEDRGEEGVEYPGARLTERELRKLIDRIKQDERQPK
jgi:acyl transferase domain-containing protein